MPKLLRGQIPRRRGVHRAHLLFQVGPHANRSAMVRVIPFMVLVVASTCRPCMGADDWPQFRGPTGQGQANAHDLPLHWSQTENIRWKADIPGKGWSSPVIWDD